MSSAQAAVKFMPLPPNSIFKQGTHFNSDKLRIGAFVLLPAVSGNSQTFQCKKLSSYFSLNSVLQSEAEQTKGNQDKHPSEWWFPPAGFLHGDLLCHCESWSAEIFLLYKSYCEANLGHSKGLI